MECIEDSKFSSNEVAILQELLSQLQEELKKERSLRLAVEEECDLLAMVKNALGIHPYLIHYLNILPFTTHVQKENNILRGKVEALNGKKYSVDNSVRGGEPKTLESSSSSIEDVEVFVEGEGRFAQHKHLRIDNASGGKNVLCVAFLTFSQCNFALVLCGGVDGKNTKMKG